MKSQNLVAGVDVSKDTLDIYYNTPDGKEQYLKTTNDKKGHQAILLKLGVATTYVMEASGPYYLRLAFLLKTSGAAVRVENPIAVKRFIQMQLERNKSDKKDARWLFHFGVQREGGLWNLPSKENLKCTSIMASIDLFTRQLTQVTNQLHALEQLPLMCKEAQKSLLKIKATLEKQVSLLEKQLHKNLIHWQPDQLKAVSSIPGLGKRATALLIVYTDGFTKIKNHRQLIALAGLSPREHTSGSSIRGRKGICKMGNGHLRNVLYMCSLSAIVHNKSCKELYDRLKAKGKRSKVALIAVCNKLIKQAFAIATKRTTYQPDYMSKLT
jgi:transposase